MRDNRCSVNPIRLDVWEHVYVWKSVDSLADGAFAAGFITGDGSFGIRPNNSGASWACTLQIMLRDDDTPLLARLCRWSNAGRLYAAPGRGRSNPQTLWVVGRQADCLKLVRILERHPLLGKKAGEFVIWRRAVRGGLGLNRVGLTSSPTAPANFLRSAGSSTRRPSLALT
jgi:LAGLIDADG endonuclease